MGCLKLIKILSHKLIKNNINEIKKKLKFTIIPFVEISLHVTNIFVA